jgi:thioredoxin 1
MGSFLSSLVTPPPAADDPNCAVVAAHSKATYDEQWAAHKSSGKLVSPSSFSALPALPRPSVPWI